MKSKKEINVNVLPRLLVGLSDCCNKSLQLFATWLQQKSNHLSKRSRRLSLLFFCVVVTTVSVMLLAESLGKSTGIIYSVTPFKMVPVERVTPQGSVISLTEYRKIEHFRTYLDSLPQKSRDSLLSLRPHLLDTLDFLRIIYLKQSKK